MVIQLQDIPTVKIDELRRLMINKSHLNSWEGEGTSGIEKIIQNHGFIQLDPLNPAGRNHDMFFFSRMAEYNIGQSENHLYPNKKVFESYFHNLNMISREYFPVFYSRKTRDHLHRYYLDRLIQIETNYPELIPQFFDFIEANGPIKSDDLKQFGKPATGDSKWSESRFQANILEIFWALGDLVVVKRDDQFKKYYDLAYKHLSSEEKKRKTYSDAKLVDLQMNLLLHYFPIISSKIAVNKSGILRLPTGKNAWVKKLGKPLESFIETNIKGEKGKYKPNLIYCPETKKIYIVSQNWNKYLENDFDDHLRALGPLDPIIWDRDLLQDIFNFDYLWEIYKPIPERKWGYYHYPLIYQGKFIGRVETKIPKSSSTLEFYNFFPENGVKYSKPIKSAFTELIKRWENMTGAKFASFDSSLAKLR